MRRLISAVTLGGGILFAASAFAQTAPANAPTFSKDIAPIFQAKCQACHQPNSVAPMSLISYEDALRNADSKNELRLRVKLESKRNTCLLMGSSSRVSLCWGERGTSECVVVAVEATPGLVSRFSVVLVKGTLSERNKSLKLP